MMKNSYTVSRIYYVLLVKYANKCYIISDVICVNMHLLTADDRALILALQVEKRWNVNKMILEFPNIQWKRRILYYLLRKKGSTGSDVDHLKDVLCHCWDMIS